MLQRCYVSVGNVCRQGKNKANPGDIAIDCNGELIALLYVVVYLQICMHTYY